MMRLRSALLQSCAVLLLLLATALVADAQNSPFSGTVSLGISGDKFTNNGSPTFLLGVSYFDALGWKTSDLDNLAARQVNLIRIWLDWKVWNGRDRSFFDANGDLLHPQTLLDLVRAAAARGIIVDVTILNGASSVSASSPQPMNGINAALNAVRNTVRLLRDEPNVFYDLVNEHNVDWSQGHETMALLMAAARQEDANAILTYSYSGEHVMPTDTSVNTAMISDELATGLQALAPHWGRCPDWWDLTDVRVLTLKTYLQSIGRNLPIYVQEESRRKGVNCDHEPTQDNFLQSAREARDAGAAAWVFHTDAGFDLSGSKTFFSRLDNVEQATMDALGDFVLGGIGPPRLSPTPLPSSPDWTHCASEGGHCSFSGTKIVRYGAKGTYFYGSFTNGVYCDNNVFGDPLFGFGKTCHYAHVLP